MAMARPSSARPKATAAGPGASLAASAASESNSAEIRLAKRRPVLAGPGRVSQQVKQPVGEGSARGMDQQDQVSLPGQHPIPVDRPQAGQDLDSLFCHQTLPPMKRHRMKGTRIGPLATSQTPSQIRTNWIDKRGPADVAHDPRHGAGAEQQPDQQTLRYPGSQPEQRRPVLFPAPLHQEMVEELPEHAQHGDAQEDQEAVPVLVAERRAARQDRDDHERYEAADDSQQEDPGLYPAAQGGNHAGTCPYRSVGILGKRIMAAGSWPSAAIGKRNGPGRFSGRIPAGPGRR